MWMRGLLSGLLCLLFFPAGSVAARTTVTIDPEERYQTVEGWGTCLVAWRPEFRELYRTEEFQRVYSQELGMNVLRINFRGPVSTEPVEDWRDIRWQDFNFMESDGRAQIFIDFGQGLMALNPETKFIASVWSPPPWMKYTQSTRDEASGAIGAFSYEHRRTGEIVENRVKPEYFQHFVKWMVEMVKAHDAQGVPIYAISPANEPQFTQTFESCVWTAEDLATVIGMLGEMLEEEGLGHVKIFAPETMTGHFYEGGTPDYIRIMAEHERGGPHFDVIATHGYSDGVEAEIDENVSRRFYEMAKEYERPLWVTEGGTRGHDWPEPIRRGVANMFHNALVAGHVSMVVPWQVTDRSPMTHNLMVFEEWTPKTYAARHYSYFIRPGAVRIGAEPGYGDVLSSAFLHEEDGQLTAVIINPTGQARDVTLRFTQNLGFDRMEAHRTSDEEQMQRLAPVTVSDRQATLAMPAYSIVTLQGRTSQ